MNTEVGMGAIELRSVEKWFEEHQVIPGVDMLIEEGEFVVFVGPSGCGKSTLLRMIGGLEETSRGQILIDGKDVTGEPPAKRGLTMVFQCSHAKVFANFGKKSLQVARKIRAFFWAKAVGKLTIFRYVCFCIPVKTRMWTPPLVQAYVDEAGSGWEDARPPPSPSVQENCLLGEIIRRRRFRGRNQPGTGRRRALARTLNS